MEPSAVSGAKTATNAAKDTGRRGDTNTPPAADKSARIHSGPAMTAGGSWGCPVVPAAATGPKKVRKIARNM